MTTPSPARIYDYMLGGTDNYEVDRAAAEILLKSFPDTKAAAQTNRDWIGRVGRHAIRDGVTQFIDIGSGLPTADNVHQVAQRHAPAARVAYSDNDPIVLAHGRHLLADNQLTRYIEADARDPEKVLADAAELLDFNQPVALIMAAVLHFIPAEDDPAGLVATYAAALPPGSCVAISHATCDGAEPGLIEVLKQAFAGLYPRPESAITAMFGPLKLIDPGLTDLQAWHPERAEPLGPLRVVGGLAKI